VRKTPLRYSLKHQEKDWTGGNRRLLRQVSGK